jgi:hypothetical protein
MRARIAAAVAVTVSLSACAGPAPTPVPTPPAASTPSARSSATAGASGTAVTFRAADGVTVDGRLFGSGRVGVVLSNMGDNDPGPWERFASSLRAGPYSVLTYRYRYPARSATFTTEMAHDALDDLVGAVAYLRGHGATSIVLIGASLGGMLTAIGARAAGARAVAIIAAPANRPDFGLTVAPSDLAAVGGLKLFVASEDDPTVAMAETRGLYERAPEPKMWKVFASTAHGTQLFATEHADALRTLLLEFIVAAV